jgi:hypothetical protein
MSTQQIQDWVQRLQVGTLELFDLEVFEKLQIEDLTHELGSAYPLRFLQRRQKTKQEIGLAQSQSSSKRWPTKLLRQCLLFTSESGLMTAMAAMTQLRFRPSQRQEGIFELTSGAGFSVYHDPDGWRIKLLQERTVSLPRKTLREKGWLLLDGNGTAQSKE